VAEELRFEQILGDRGAVHLHERILALRAVEVDRARDHLLARAGLAGDEHGALRLGHHFGVWMTSWIRRLRPTMPYWLNSSSRSFSRYRAACEALVIERAVDDDEQLVDLEGLLQVVERAQLHRLDRALDGGVRGHQQDLRRSSTGVVATSSRITSRPSARASGCRAPARRSCRG
jgi:hypothetical protein